MSENKKICSDCGAELVSTVVSTYGAEWYCPNCDDNFWKRMKRSNDINLKELKIIVGGKVGDPMQVFIDNIPLEGVHAILEENTKEIRLKQKIKEIDKFL